jgi:hypothetical protein
MPGRSTCVALLLLAVLAGCGSPNVNTSASPGGSGSGPTPAGATAGSGWQLISNFPLDGAAQVNAIVAQAGGFVAVGTIADDTATCIADINNGHVWTTSDGLTWVPAPADPFSQTDLTHLVTFKSAVYAFGFVGAFEEETAGCGPGANPTGVNIWRSTNSGTSWEHLQQSAAIAHATIGDVVVAGETLVLVGSQVDAEGNDVAAAWSSSDALTWTAAELPPATSIMGSAAARENVVVGFGFDPDFPLPWISRDGGGHWYEESIDVAGTENSDADTGLGIEDVLATPAGYVAVGDVCCLGAAQIVPLAVTTPDGTQWQGAPVPADTPQAMRLLGQLPGGLLAVGVRTYLDEAPPAGELGGRSWTSADGKAWLAGPPFAELGDGNVTAMAVGTNGVALAGTTFVDAPTSGGDTGVRVWYAPLSAFEGGTSK